MKIAITSQNRKQVTANAGRCRKFWIYEIIEGRVVDKTLLELPLEQSFHASPPDAPHPLDGVQVLITGGMGQGMVTRLASKHIEGLITTETDPDRAVALYLVGSLPQGEPEAGTVPRQMQREQQVREKEQP
ncbi:MAG: NifB/NifX family molybdenum-iron cluster-binding protein [Thiomonas sp.]|uniref:NifB/NifX family molybdenum-iron cluster-binding protein n=1 Tax=Thiomonas sp. TaxID=2047785 RepID=UPI002A362F83|nr:NifB/NifX family molybdenum-iron cluster-binding protein [Thiomonas sp.]MDY0331053.1 NifB/NifX family molybdenum-iron cluster-binding protein [Thiomonas sp.]